MNKKELEKNVKIEIIQINKDNLFMIFGVPEKYELSKIKLDGFKTYRIGKLKSLNRIKGLQYLRKNNDNLIEIFINILKHKKWDFDTYPNPEIYLHYRN